MLVGHLERPARSSRALRARRRSRRRRAASRGLPVPALVGAPKPIVVRQAISVGLSVSARRRAPRRSASGSWPSMRVAAQPAALKRLQLVAESASDGGPSMVMPLSSNSTISLSELQVAGERDRLVADAFHQAAVAGDHLGVVVDEVVAEPRGEVALGHRHADGVGEALAQRAGGGLDARRAGRIRVARRDASRAGGSA